MRLNHLPNLDPPCHLTLVSCQEEKKEKHLVSLCTSLLLQTHQSLSEHQPTQTAQDCHQVSENQPTKPSRGGGGKEQENPGQMRCAKRNRKLSQQFAISLKHSGGVLGKQIKTGFKMMELGQQRGQWLELGGPLNLKTERSLSFLTLFHIPRRQW